MKLQSIKSHEYTDEKVLVRVDLNVDLKNSEEHFRFGIIRETLDYLFSFDGVKVALLAHLGRPEGKDANFSLKQLTPAIEQALQRKVVFVADCHGELVKEALAKLQNNEVLLMENVRFYPGEEENDSEFAKLLAEPFTAYVNEAFSVSHRAHASVEAITHFLPAVAGLRLEKEVTELDRVRFSPEHPAVAIIGGAKIETKLPLIKALEKEYDTILVGGMIANEALDQKLSFSEKVFLPEDFDSEARLDIGPATVAHFSDVIKTAKTIIWNGPLGKFEEKPYDQGTAGVLQAILASGAFVVVGGGESLSMLKEAGATEKMGFVSSGGGAMLEYMSGADLPGLLVLRA